MDRHTSELLHDPIAHEPVRRFEVFVSVAVAIVVLYGILYYAVF
jgi:hypothetical protein